MTDDLARRLTEIRTAIATAARRAGRDPTAVRIMAITKTFSPATVLAALAAGLSDIGENYVQEARAKRSAVGAGTWHLIGGLQRNKVRAAATVFDEVVSLDSSALAAALAAEAARAGRRLGACIQVNVSADASRRGADPDDVESLGRTILALPTLELRGLTAVPPPGPPETARAPYRLLREVRDRAAKRLGVELPRLCMGMSDDFTVAVEEGATLLRLGRALFGARGPGSWRPGGPAGGEGS